MTLLLLLACATPDTDPVEICDDGLDNDGDGLRDCFDADCVDACPKELNCADGLDNDRDQLIDCFDPDCASSCTEEACDGLDGDQDGLVDCQDPDCAEYCREDCGDGEDNDFDKDVDCRDSDCEEDPACIEDCSDGVDNNDNGRVDCEDADCTRDPACAEDCFDGADNDADGLVDCEDSECVGVCTETSCVDELDNDLDGLVDCEDEECWGLGSCPSGIQVRVLSGHGDYNRARAGGKWSSNSSSSRDLQLRSVVGSAQVQLSASSLSCTWTGGLEFRARWDSYFTQGLSAQQISSSGACEGWVNTGAFRSRHIPSDWMSPGTWQMGRVDFPMEYKGALLIHGSTFSSSVYSAQDSTWQTSGSHRAVNLEPGAWFLMPGSRL